MTAKHNDSDQTTESTEEEMDLKLEVRRAAAAAARGDMSKLDKLLDDEKISNRQYKRVMKKIPRFGTQVNEDFVPEINRVISILTVPNTLRVIDKMTTTEKELSRDLVEKKYNNMVKRKEHGQTYMDEQEAELLKRGYDI